MAHARVLGIQRKLHKSSIDDQDRRFKDLRTLVCDPATLMVARLRVRANRGSRSAGVDRQTARYIEQVLGVQKFLDGLQGLRVIDASVMPQIVAGNTNAPTSVIADRGAELILGLVAAAA